MINLADNDYLLRKEIAVTLALVGDAVENDEDLNQAREELAAHITKLEYVLLLEG